MLGFTCYQACCQPPHKWLPRRSQVAVFMVYVLKNKAHFLLMRKAPLAAKTKHFLLRTQINDREGVGIGVVVPKRCSRRAVTRNAIRRQVYGIGFRVLQAQGLPGRMVLLQQRQAFSQHIFKSAWSAALKRQVQQELYLLFASV